MYNLIISKYLDSLTIDKLNSLAIENNIYLSNEELLFSYNFIKNNYKEVLNNHSNFDINKYRNYFSEENYKKIKDLIDEYYLKYKKYL